MNETPEKRPIKTRLYSPALYTKHVQYDFTHLSWVIDGVYKCLHRPSIDCGCYGREHEGEVPEEGARIV